MSVSPWVVAVASLLAIAFVNWYFLIAPGRRPAELKGGSNEIRITVKGGYDPATIRVPAGQPVRLVFDRQETNSCSEEIVIPDLKIRRFLPAFEATAIDITLPSPGRYEFACGMNMLHGSIIAEQG
jgi:Cu+-exporting ATPase